MTDALGRQYPRLAKKLPKLAIADLPTPVREYRLADANTSNRIFVKHDDLSNELYGGNKVRKLEYLLRRVLDRNAKRVATFGTVASNHALATAVHAKQLGLPCTCFLAHQARTPKAPLALNMHLRNHTEIVRFGGDRAHRISTLRRHLQHRNAAVIPMGGSSWLGVVGFVNAGLELAEQVNAGELPVPDRLYVANGTMGTAAGLAIGLALAGLPTQIQAIRVTHEFVANRNAMQRLIVKTLGMLHRLDDAIPTATAARVRLSFRDGFFGDGYARSTPATESAIRFAGEHWALALDTTYSGKAMAALLHDLGDAALQGQTMLFWNTYNSRPLPVSAERPATADLPPEFQRYYD